MRDRYSTLLLQAVKATVTAVTMDKVRLLGWEDQKVELRVEEHRSWELWIIISKDEEDLLELVNSIRERNLV